MLKKVSEKVVVWDCVASGAPPSLDFIRTALAGSPFARYRLEADNIKEFLKAPSKQTMVKVATAHDAQCKVTVAADAMQATALLKTAQGGASISAEQLKQALVDAGVRRGTSQKVIDHLMLLQQQLPAGTEQTVLVAQGRPAVNGKDGYLKPLVATLADRVMRPVELDDGSVDMRDYGKLLSVKAGTKLVQLMPPTVGEPGFDVKGNELPATAGQETQLQVCEGTELDPQHPDILLAARPGVPVACKEGIRIDEVFSIANVDISTGHIDFDGSVIVLGDVAPGMKITADGDITIKGIVDSATLTASGNIEIGKGAIGHATDEGVSCHIEAMGDVKLGHAQYVAICGHDITIGKFASHCELTAVRRIWVGKEDKANGKLIGGEVRNAIEVHAGEVGSLGGGHTVLRLVAQVIEIQQLIDDEVKQLAQWHHNLETLQDAHDKAEHIKDEAKKADVLSRVDHTISHWQKESDRVHLMMDAQTELLTQLLAQAQLVCSATLHEGVDVYIAQKHWRATRDHPAGTLKMVNDVVEMVH